MTAEPSPDLQAPAPAGRRPHMAKVKRAVIKLGTNVLTRESGEMSLGRIHALIEDIVDLHRRGLQLILVSSGAISMGMDRLGLRKRPAFLPDKQACAAVGQIRLMSVYEQAFHRFGIETAQILLTEDDFSSRVRYLNLRNTMGRLLELCVIPIVNENDTVSTSEIETAPEGGGLEKKGVFGDNDRLSALVASKLGADLLVVLSDVDGLYPLGAGDRELPGGTTPGTAGPPIPLVHEITPEIEAMARDASGRGRGGMLSKLRSIRVALEGGSIAVIANGTRPGTLPRIFQGEEVGTIFLPRRKIPSRKRWLAYATAPAGRVIINAGARKALVEGRSSLLFAGVVRIEGEWKRGDAVTIADESGSELARGIVNYASKDALPFLGKRSAEIAEAAGKDYEELVTRDNIVVLREDQG